MAHEKINYCDRAFALIVALEQFYTVSGTSFQDYLDNLPFEVDEDVLEYFMLDGYDEEDRFLLDRFITAVQNDERYAVVVLSSLEALFMHFDLEENELIVDPRLSRTIFDSDFETWLAEVRKIEGRFEYLNAVFTSNIDLKSFQFEQFALSLYDRGCESDDMLLFVPSAN